MNVGINGLLNAQEFFSSPLFKIIAVSLAIILVLVLILVIVTTHRRNSYHKKTDMLTGTEKDYYYIIRDIIPEDCIVLPKVPLSSIIGKKSKKKEEDPMQDDVLNKTVDFVIFTGEFIPLVAIRLERMSKKKKNKKKELKDKTGFPYIFKKAGIPLITENTKLDLDEEKLQLKIIHGIRGTLTEEDAWNV